MRRSGVWIPFLAVGLAPALSTGPQPLPAPRASYVVNSSLNDPDGDVGDDICDTGTSQNPTGVCSLRAAIEQANARAGADMISFSVGSGPVRIHAFGYDVIDAVVIDGRTQPGYAGEPIVEIQGHPAFSDTGFDIAADNVQLIGLAITGFDDYGIRIRGSLNQVRGSYVGVAPDGTTAVGNGAAGIYIDGGVFEGNQIGGSDQPADRNVISANGEDGIWISGAGVGSTTIFGNYIGVDYTGTAPLGNQRHGINVEGATGTQIGGGSLLSDLSCVALCNVIGANVRDGIILQGGASNTVVRSNRIGVGVGSTLEAMMGNGDDGVSLVNAGEDNIVGKVGPEISENVIGYNEDAGVHVATSSRGKNNRVAPNRIFSNGGLGIDYGATGVDPFDPSLRNTDPVIVAFVLSASVFDGTAWSTPNTAVSVDIYSSSECDPSGFGEGEVPVGQVSGTTDADGRLDFVWEIVDPDEIDFMTATVSGPIGTSEFSSCERYDPGASGGALIVNTTDDQDDGACNASHCSLREAILAANAQAGPDDILFDIEGVGPHIIAPLEGLPSITDPATIDGASQPGYEGDPVIGVDGESAGETDGLVALSQVRLNALSIARWRGEAILIEGSEADGTVVEDVWIGVPAGTEWLDAAGLPGVDASSFAGSTGAGIVVDGAEDVRIGADPADPDPADGNVIVDNALGGIILTNGASASILGNLFGANGGLSVDLGDDGVTANDADDTDSGPNELLNFPELSAVFKGSTHVRGSYAGPPGTELRVELFASPECHPSGHGEAQRYLGAATVTTDGAGSAELTVTFPDDLATGTTVTATATDPAGRTSELSACATVADFALAATPDSVELVGQSSGSLELTVSAEGGVFAGEVALSCPDAPSEVTCSFSPATVTPGSGSVTSTLTVTRASPAAAGGLGLWLLAVAVGLLSLALAGSARATAAPGRSKAAVAASRVVTATAVVATLVFAACGDSGEPTGPDDDQPVTRSFSVRGSSGDVQHDTTLKVTIP